WEFTVSQWIDIWNNGQHYRTEKHVLVFFYPPSKLRLTSCVNDSLKRFDMNSAKVVVLDAEQQSAFKTQVILKGRDQISINDFEQAVDLAHNEWKADPR